jgi:hypothetical protein
MTKEKEMNSFYLSPNLASTEYIYFLHLCI